MAAREGFLAKVVPRQISQMDKGEQTFRAEDKATGTTQDNDKMGLAPPVKARPQRVWIHSRELGCSPEGDRKGGGR